MFTNNLMRQGSVQNTLKFFISSILILKNVCYIFLIFYICIKNMVMMFQDKHNGYS